MRIRSWSSAGVRPRTRAGTPGRVPRSVAASAGVVAAFGLAGAGGCAPATAPDEAAWAPPRGGLVTHEFAGLGGPHDRRRDERLGHPPATPTRFTITEIEFRTRLATSGNGRITDSVRRRVETTTIQRGR